jgi:hypothetical protein
MKSSSRVLMWFGAGIAVLVILTVVLALSLGQKNAPLLDPNTPEGTVQRFLLAVQDKDYTTAYNYLVPPPTPEEKGLPAGTFSYFTSSALNTTNSWKADLGKTTLLGTNATVEITLEVFASGGPFGGPIQTRSVIFSLTKTGNEWQITSPTDLYWLY